MSKWPIRYSLIAAGIERVIYIEPYAKSRAEELHEDAIVVEEKALKPSRRSKWRVPSIIL